jgi:hypothetical protein
LDKVGGGSIGPIVGQGRGKDQCSDPTTQAEEEEHNNPRTCQRETRDYEIVG